ncbi:MAG: hypothetical protein ACOYUZ_04165 [Patescibacteria group bacterium]
MIQAPAPNQPQGFKDAAAPEREFSAQGTVKVRGNENLPPFSQSVIEKPSRKKKKAA